MQPRQTAQFGQPWFNLKVSHVKLSATGTGGFYLTRTYGMVAVTQLDHFFFAEKVCFDVTDFIPVSRLDNGSDIAEFSYGGFVLMGENYPVN